MKRSTKRCRIGRAARQRIRQGGPIAKGRPAMTVSDYRTLRDRVFERAAYRCENPLCRRHVTLDLEHARPRSQGGPDSLDNCWAACRACHRLKDRRVLMVVPDGNETFEFIWKGRVVIGRYGILLASFTGQSNVRMAQDAAPQNLKEPHVPANWLPTQDWKEKYREKDGED